MLLVGAVFIRAPGGIAPTRLFGFSGAANEPSAWIIRAVIFVYRKGLSLRESKARLEAVPVSQAAPVRACAAD
jgi:hypothetical protein